MSQVVQFAPIRAATVQGVGIAGAEARFFVTQTTTPVTVYSDAALAVPHATPLVADAEGVFPAVFTDGATDLKVEVRDAESVMLTGYPIDPVAVSSLGSDAAEVSFEATPDIAATDVQAAIEAVRAAILPLIQSFGIGVTGATQILSSWTATNISSGQFRATTASTAAPEGSPTGAAGNFTVVFARLGSANGVRWAVQAGSGTLYQQRLEGSTWLPWVVIGRPLAGHDATAWNAGALDTLDLISPELLKGAVATFVGDLRAQAMIVQERTALGAARGLESASGGWATLRVNTEVSNAITGASIDTGTYTITLPAGRYQVEGSSFGGDSNVFQCRLRDITNSATLALGTTLRNGGTEFSSSVLFGAFTLTEATEIRLQQTDAGRASGTYSVGEANVWAAMKINRIGA